MAAESALGCEDSVVLKDGGLCCHPGDVTARKDAASALPNLLRCACAIGVWASAGTVRCDQAGRV